MLLDLRTKAILVLCILVGFSSCSESDDILDDVISVELSDKEIGRFDNRAFEWDESNYLKSSDCIFIGDKFEVSNANAATMTRSYRNLDNFIINPISIFLGGVFKENEFNTKFSEQVLETKNPIDVVFEFNKPFISTIPKQTTSIGYKKCLKQALASVEYASHVKGNNKSSVEYDMTEWSTYRDLEKAFGANASFAKVFSTKVEQNSKNTNAKGKLLAKLIVKYYDCYMEPTNGGIFENPEFNSSKRSVRDSRNMTYGDHIYVKTLTYGKVAYVAIESEYSYSELKSAVSASVSIGSFGGGGSFSQKNIDIFNKSTVTAFMIGENSDTKFYTDVKSLNAAFASKLNIESVGYPIYCQGRYVHNHKAFIPEKNISTGNTGRTSDNLSHGGSAGAGRKGSGSTSL